MRASIPTRQLRSRRNALVLSSAARVGLSRPLRCSPIRVTRTTQLYKSGLTSYLGSLGEGAPWGPIVRWSGSYVSAEDLGDEDYERATDGEQEFVDASC